jgi:hypothetical protein
MNYFFNTARFPVMRVKEEAVYEKLLNLGAYATETAAKLLFLMRSLLKVHNMNN